MTVIPLLTFRQKVAPIEALCRRVIADAGGQLRRRARGEVSRAGYAFPAPVAPESQADYALKILRTLAAAHAMSTGDPDTAMKLTWDAARLLTEASERFPLIRQRLEASQKGVMARLAMRDEDSSAELAGGWAAAVNGRPESETKVSVMDRLAFNHLQDQGLDEHNLEARRKTVEKIKKAIRRHEAARSK